MSICSDSLSVCSLYVFTLCVHSRCVAHSLTPPPHTHTHTNSLSRNPTASLSRSLTHAVTNSHIHAVTRALTHSRNSLCAIHVYFSAYVCVCVVCVGEGGGYLWVQASTNVRLLLFQPFVIQKLYSTMCYFPQSCAVVPTMCSSPSLPATAPPDADLCHHDHLPLPERLRECSLVGWGGVRGAVRCSACA